MGDDVVMPKTFRSEHPRGTLHDRWFWAASSRASPTPKTRGAATRNSCQLMRRPGRAGQRRKRTFDMVRSRRREGYLIALRLFGSNSVERCPSRFTPCG